MKGDGSAGPEFSSSVPRFIWICREFIANCEAAQRYLVQQTLRKESSYLGNDLLDLLR
jgi:hypothetical protein